MSKCEHMGRKVILPAPKGMGTRLGPMKWMTKKIVMCEQCNTTIYKIHKAKVVG